MTQSNSTTGFDSLSGIQPRYWAEAIITDPERFQTRTRYKERYEMLKLSENFMDAAYSQLNEIGQSADPSDVCYQHIRNECTLLYKDAVTSGASRDELDWLDGQISQLCYFFRVSSM